MTEELLTQTAQPAETKQIIRVIGHKNPDTDSVCSAIAYAYLKNQISNEVHEPRRAGEISRETAFVLDHFRVNKPRLSEDMGPTIQNIDVLKEPGIEEEMTVRAAWQRMMDHDVDTLCVVNPQGKLFGMITVKDLASANMDTFDRTILAEACTRFRKLAETVEGEILFGDPRRKIRKGRIMIGTSPEAMKEMLLPGDLVLVTNRREVQACALECGAGCLVVCMDADVPEDILEQAKKQGCVVIRTRYDTYAAARLVSMAAPVGYYMRRDNLVTFRIRTPIADVKKVMRKYRLHYFPILTKSGIYQGMISRQNLLGVSRKRVILVDHNEKSQAVDGLEEAEILEIIDHHRVGTLETGNPVYFRNEPVGCTATIVWSMYRENRVEIPQDMAGLLLSAILSDTLMFHSPTCTNADRAAARELAALAGEDLTAYGNSMFEAGEDLTDRKPEELLYSDYKEFALGNVSLAVAQGFFVSAQAFRQAGEMVQSVLRQAWELSGKDMLLYMLTSVPERSTLLFFAGKDAEEIIREAFHVETAGGSAWLSGVVSRKLELIPPIRERLLQ